MGGERGGGGREGGGGKVPRSLSCHDDEERRPDMELGDVGEDIVCRWCERESWAVWKDDEVEIGRSLFG